MWRLSLERTSEEMTIVKILKFNVCKNQKNGGNSEFVN